MPWKIIKSFISLEMAPACGVSDLQFEYSLNELLKVGIS